MSLMWLKLEVRFLIVLLGNKAVKNGAEFINVHEVFFDSSHVAAGGLLIANCISVRW